MVSTHAIKKLNDVELIIDPGEAVWPSSSPSGAAPPPCSQTRTMNIPQTAPWRQLLLSINKIPLLFTLDYLNNSFCQLLESIYKPINTNLQPGVTPFGKDE